jgi:hypothetical protein
MAEPWAPRDASKGSQKNKKKSCLALDLEKFETLSNLETKNAKLLMIKT